VQTQRQSVAVARAETLELDAVGLDGEAVLAAGLLGVGGHTRGVTSLV
jgi:hypothetical protein